MILSVLLSVSFTFTVTATGVEKGTAVEFLVAGQNTDRDYESMFVLDEPVDAFCRRLEAIVPRGTPVDATTCRLWPTGCRLRFEPSFDKFVNFEAQEKGIPYVPIYTGGTRRPNGSLEATDVMPAAVFATYSLPQAPIVYNDPLDQGSAYGKFTAAAKLEKGTKYTFKLISDDKSSPKKLEMTAEKGQLKDLLKQLQTASSAGEVDALVSFSDKLTVGEAVAVAQALAVIDSSRVKINGKSGLFYRAFLPLEKWRDRQERLQQPFELTLCADGTETLLHIDEDWTVEGDDPKLTPQQISYEQAVNFPKTDTCFIYASKTQTVSRIFGAMKHFPKASIRNWYVFPTDLL